MSFIAFRARAMRSLTYIGKSTRHVVITTKKNLNLGSLVKSKIKKHIIERNSCNKKVTDNLMNHFVVVKKCLSNYDCKIHKAL